MSDHRMTAATIRQIDASLQDERLRRMANAARLLDDARTKAREAAKELDRANGVTRAHKNVIKVMDAADTALGSIADASRDE